LHQKLLFTLDNRSNTNNTINIKLFNNQKVDKKLCDNQIKTQNQVELGF